MPGGVAQVDRAFCRPDGDDPSRGRRRRLARRYVRAARRPQAEPAKKIEADLCWFDDSAAVDTTQSICSDSRPPTPCSRIGSIKEVLDVHTLSQSTDRRELRDERHRPRGAHVAKSRWCATCTTRIRGTGAFVLIDEATHHTVAAGMIRRVLGVRRSGFACERPTNRLDTKWVRFI